MLVGSREDDVRVSDPNGARSTIADVASAAGVSRATVSRVMNNQSTVNADLARRVREVAATLGYRPSNVARSLSLGRTNTVGVVVPDMGNPMFQGVIRGLTAAAADEGYRVMVSETDEAASVEPDLAREARARCDAVVLISPSAPVQTVRDLVEELGPAVIIGRGVDGSGPAGLAVDYAAGVQILVDHLRGLGHRDFIYLSGPPASPGNQSRLVGFERIEREHPQLRISHLSCGSRLEDGHAAAVRVLAGQSTAVIAYNDLVAFGLLSRLNETGVAVPQDFSVVGLDDITLAGYAVPPLTTLAVPGEELGRRGWAHLRSRIQGEEPPEEQPLVPRLVERESTGPVAPRKAPHRRRISSPSVTSVHWHAEAGADVLMGDQVPLLRYERGEQMPTVHAPRPYAHPIHSLAGVPLTTAGPRLHRHQHGLSVAIPDVNGTSYWGGRTFLPEVGATLLPNHGRQRVLDRTVDQTGDPTRARLREKLVWQDEYGDDWLTEDRSIAGTLLPRISGWQLAWRSELHAEHTDIVFASPATHGRHGAGYGGIFWRFDSNPVQAIFSAHGDGEQAVHGREAAWVTLVRGGPQGTTSVILRQRGDVLPWFCRVSDYTGLGPAVAWDRERTLPFGGALSLQLEAIILDRGVRPDEIEDLLDAADTAAG
jgi:LacI family transcriptional regulator